MGRIAREQCVCDFCGRAIGEETLIGRLNLRKLGTRGLGRNFEIALHDTCSEKFTRHTASAATRRKAAPSWVVGNGLPCRPRLHKNVATGLHPG